MRPLRAVLVIALLLFAAPALVAFPLAAAEDPPAWPPPREPRAIPTAASALLLPVQVQDHRIESDAHFARDKASGKISGAGTVEDPYVIEGWNVRGELSIRGTSAAFVIRGVHVGETLRLAYNGPHVHVHDTFAKDLRVNPNVVRTTLTTAGTIEHNRFLFIGQLRHWSGEFAHNLIGPRPDSVSGEYEGDEGIATLPIDVVWNFDGFHNADVHDNRVDGAVRIKVHGHYHGSCADCPHHEHVVGAPGHVASPTHGHRWHSMRFENNRIDVGAAGHDYALRVHDTAHAADDRRANSERTAPAGEPEALNGTHMHHVEVSLVGNTIKGARVRVDGFVAADPSHAGIPQHAALALSGNHVEIPVQAGIPRPMRQQAYDLLDMRSVDVVADANAYRYVRGAPIPGQLEAHTDGVRIHGVSGAVALARTQGEGAGTGVFVRMSPDLSLSLVDNEWNAPVAVDRR